ncbi:YjbQ family protein [Thermosipho ferrireducens]|uniref:YjbQ family protein n=1 Tax=Thermosipho ferrireducens TaxID=2571116 RepID=A0ABX7S945_9BACT|nr:secondary thiamine-phosphate synthase enzyme YjbQ [Thermosipho ferrireducens]QTA38380.1 YjbQ family protein [Thermosipho ferrireducens]
MVYTLEVNTTARNQFVDITADIERLIREAGINSGICIIFVPHTTAGITINENADPSVKRDLENTLKKIVPPNWGYTHLEGNSDSHVKSSLIGPSISLIVENGQLLLGTWQGIYFCEFDGPRRRKVYVKILKG